MGNRPGEPKPYIAGEELKQGELVFIGEDGKLYKMNPLLLTRPVKVKIKAEIHPARNIKAKVAQPGQKSKSAVWNNERVTAIDGKPVKKVNAQKKQPENLSKEPGVFLTDKMKQAREARQAQQAAGGSTGTNNDDWLLGDDEETAKRKAALQKKAQVVVVGGWDSSLSGNQKAKRAKGKKQPESNDDTEL